MKKEIELTDEQLVDFCEFCIKLVGKESFLDYCNRDKPTSLPDGRKYSVEQEGEGAVKPLPPEQLQEAIDAFMKPYFPEVPMSGYRNVLDYRRLNENQRHKRNCILLGMTEVVTNPQKYFSQPSEGEKAREIAEVWEAAIKALRICSYDYSLDGGSAGIITEELTRLKNECIAKYSSLSTPA